MPAAAPHRTAPDSPSASPQFSTEIDVRALTAGASTATLVLDGQPYTLRITRLGKLILTK
jgi:hemin uptake protein HemP